VLTPPIDSDEMLSRSDSASLRALEKLFLDAAGYGRRQLLKRCEQAGSLLRLGFHDA
jgi:hypothetical protein